MNKVFKIVELLRQQKTGRLSAEEEQELQKWIEENGNQLFTAELLSDKREECVLKEMGQYDSAKAYRKFIVNGKRFQFRRKMWWVAAIIVPMTLASILFFHRENGFENALVTQVSPVIKPGEVQAILTLGGGEKVMLGKEEPLFLKMSEGLRIKSDSSGLVYEKDFETLEQLVFNELMVPRRGEYSLTLVDGSRIHLNADSYLKYPETFGKDKRVVELKGEAYFEVTEDSLRPFVVKVGEMQVQVLGTVFNINAYGDSPEVQTTLVSGKVHVVSESEVLELLPGEQACMYKLDGSIHKKNVNIAIYTAWKDGLFKFEREPLVNIMKVLERWYDVNVFFKNETLKHSLFSGDLKKYDTIEQHLRMLELTTNVSFVINGNNVFVGYQN